MSKQWSDHFADSQPGLTLNSQRRLSAGVTHSRLRYRRAEVTLDLAPAAFTDGDEARIMQMLSSDRLIELFVTCDNASGTLTTDVGLYLTGVAHDGAVVDIDLFGADLAINGGVDHVDQLTAGALENLDRGKTLYDMASEGRGDTVYSADNIVPMDIVLTASATIATADTVVVVEAYFTSGD